MMQLIAATHLDKQAWDALVAQSGGSVFSLSGYLDATADHWGVLYNADRTGGIACPFALKAGIQILYAPFFHRYTEWIGAGNPGEEVLAASLQQHFKVADAHCRTPLSGKLVHQVVSRETFALSQQAKRMLKKATDFQVRIETHHSRLLDLLQQELAPRIAGIDAFSLLRLKQLIAAFEHNGLKQYNLYEENNWLGGIWILEFGQTALYLKGTTTAAAKQNGGMYRLMHTAITHALENGQQFDFGGSNADGVRRFNRTFGAFDVSYSQLQWNNAPLWWKTVKSLRQKWNSR